MPGPEQVLGLSCSPGQSGGEGTNPSAHAGQGAAGCKWQQQTTHSARSIWQKLVGSRVRFLRSHRQESSTEPRSHSTLSFVGALHWSCAAYSWDIVPLVAPGHIAGASGLGGASGPYARSLVSYVLEATGTLAAIGTGSASSSVSQFLNKKKNISLPFFKSSGEEKDKERKQSKEREKERSPSGGALVSVPSTHVGAALPAPVLNATTVETWAEGLPFASMQRIAGTPPLPSPPLRPFLARALHCLGSSLLPGQCAPSV